MHLSDFETLRSIAIVLGCIAAVIAGTWHVRHLDPPFSSGKPNKPGVYAVKIQPTDVFSQFAYFNGYDFNQPADTITGALRSTAISRINWYWQEIEEV